MTLPLWQKVCKQMLPHIGMYEQEKAAEKRPRKFQVQLRKLGQMSF